jgi:hypothetical protein
VDDSDETFGEAIEALRAATVRLGRVGEEMVWDGAEQARIEEQLVILDDVLDDLELLYDEAFSKLI